MNTEQILRNDLLELLEGGGAHATFDHAVAGFTEELRGAIPDRGEHSAWQIVEHLRYCQEDILEYMLADEYRQRNFPGDYWVSNPRPSTGAWEKSIELFHKDLDTLKAITADLSVNIYQTVPHGPHTLLREIILIGDHNAYHIGQLIQLRDQLGLDTPF
jgi:hypothetical protein